MAAELEKRFPSAQASASLLALMPARARENGEPRRARAVLPVAGLLFALHPGNSRFLRRLWQYRLSFLPVPGE